MNDPMACERGRHGTIKFMAGIIIGSIVVGIIAVWLTPIVRQYFTVDRCLDAGGAYDHRQNRCILPAQ